MHPKRTPAAGLVLGLLVFGTAVHAETYDFREGWRNGVVLRLGTSEQIAKRKFSDCRESATPEQLAGGRFVELSYKHFGRPHLHVALRRVGDTF